MNFFKQLHKSAFLSQFLLGMVAIFALPSAYSQAEVPQTPIVKQQSVTLSELSAAVKTDEHAHFLQFEPPQHAVTRLQAGRSPAIFVIPHSFDGIAIPPIRAGPAFH